MDNKQKKVEYKLRQYYRGIRVIERIERNINKLESDIKELMHYRRELKFFKIKDDGLRATDYSVEKVQTSGNVSIMERELVIQSEDLERKISTLIKEKMQLIQRKQNKERKMLGIGQVLEMFDEEEQELLELKYSANKTLLQISHIICLDLSTVKRRVDRLLDGIAKELGL